MLMVPKLVSAAAIDALLPQTQCQRCGYADCHAYAEAMHAFRRANNRVGWAHGQACGAPDAGRLRNERNMLRCIGIDVICKRNWLARQQRGQRDARRISSRRTAIDLSLARMHRLGIGVAIGIAAALALRLRQQRINRHDAD